jgi:hypothetical protein
VTAEAEEEEEVVISPSARAEKQKGTEAKGGRGGGKEGINGRGRREEDRKKQDMVAAILVREKPKGIDRQKKKSHVLYLGRVQWGIRITVQTQQVPDGKVCNGDGRGSASTCRYRYGPGAGALRSARGAAARL